MHNFFPTSIKVFADRVNIFLKIYHLLWFYSSYIQLFSGIVNSCKEPSAVAQSIIINKVRANENCNYQNLTEIKFQLEIFALYRPKYENDINCFKIIVKMVKQGRFSMECLKTDLHEEEMFLKRTTTLIFGTYLSDCPKYAIFSTFKTVLKMIL